MPVRFALAKKRMKQAEFIERKRPGVAPRPVQQAPAIPVPAEPPKKPDASQAALPLSPPPAAKAKDVYVWDESKGID